MNLRPVLLVTVTIILGAWACEPNQYQSGCNIIGASCKCGTGCNKTEYVYKTRRACRNALRAPAVAAPARSPNICSNSPCLRGTCIQTTNDIGFTCKCEGTGFYGQRCEKACSTTQIRGMVFPHECVVI